MEIRIKTHDEARSGRVTIEIDGETAYTAEPDPAPDLVGPEQITDLEAQVAELKQELSAAIVSGEGYRQQAEGFDLDRHTEQDRANKAITALADMMVKRDDAFRQRDNAQAVVRTMAEERDSAINALQRCIEERDIERERAGENVERYIEERDAQRQRAGENREWAERADERLGQAELKLHKIEKIISRQVITDTLARDWTSWTHSEATGIVTVVDDIRRMFEPENPDCVIVE